MGNDAYIHDLEIVYLSPDELTPYEKNTRRHTPDDIEGIKKSILDVGFADPIAVWGEKNLIVEGHGRVIAAKELHLDKVPVIRLDQMTETQQREYRIRHNRSAELSEWDFPTLAEEIASLEIEGVDMDDLDFNFDDIEGFSDNDNGVVEDEAPEVEEKTKSRLGQIYQLGRHRLMCGDSTDPDAVKILMGGG